VSLSDGQPGQMNCLVLRLPAEADQVPVARRAVAEFCELYGLAAPLIDDVKLVVTEACTNVVLHAYAGREPGSIELDAFATEDELRLLVRDRGAGMTPAPMAEGLGLGLPLIAALTSTLTIIEPDEGGTEVSMTFALRDTTSDS